MASLADGGGRAPEPADLGRLFLERASLGDVDGVVALYEQEAVLVAPDGRKVVGLDAIRAFYQSLFATSPQFPGEVQPPIQCGDVALTSTHFPGGATAEVARRQADGSWLWAIDQPNV